LSEINDDDESDFATKFNCNFYATTNFFEHFPNIHRFQTVNCGTSLAYVTVSVQSDHILPQLQQHLVKRRTTFQQCIVERG